MNKYAVAIVAFVGGVLLMLYVGLTPGSQLLQALLGGAAIGVAIGIWRSQ